MDDACLSSHGEGNLSNKDLERLKGVINQTLKGVDLSRIKNAVILGNKDEFKEDIKKKQNLDEGPPNARKA